ncbi:MAG TPA: hypothetical protein VEX65_08655 [Flavisolibacter sp.]|jgi:hypothetical protein|nr:hypothetical protein [Flavisolibacter sp.]
MKATTVLAGGLAGATAVTIIHESIKAVVPQAPRMDRLGMEAISKGLRKAGKRVPDQDALFSMAMVGDLVSNAIYYSAAGIGNEKNIWLRSTLLGLSAGIGAVVLPGPLGLSKKHSNKTVATQVMTVGLYVAGSLVTTAVIKLLNKKKEKSHTEWERRLVTSAMG